MAFPPTDWLDWTTAEYDVGAPATSLSFERWFRNPVALAQGAVGAPKIEGQALGNYIGGGKTDDNAIAFVFSSRGLWLDLRVHLAAPFNGLAQFRTAYSNDGGATWGGWQNMGPPSFGDSVASISIAKSFSAMLNLTSGAYNLVGYDGGQLGTHTIPADCNAIRVSSNASGVDATFQMFLAGGRP